MSESDRIQAEIRRLGIQTEDVMSTLLASLKKRMEELEAVVEQQGLLIQELQDKLKEPVKVEINREERERIDQLEEKLDRVEHTAQHAAHMTTRAFTPLPKKSWKTSSEVSFTLVKEVPPVIPPIEPPCPTETSCSRFKKVVRKKQASANGRSQKQNVVIQQSPVAK